MISGSTLSKTLRCKTERVDAHIMLHTERPIVVTLIEVHIENGCRICAHDEDVESPVKCEISRDDVAYRHCMSYLRGFLENECI